MDRFIGQKFIEINGTEMHLKSNMDRFIGMTSTQQTSCLII